MTSNRTRTRLHLIRCAAWEEGSRAVEQVKAAEQTHLRVGTNVAARCPPCAGASPHRHPSDELELRHIGWQDPTAGLSDGTTDVAFVWLPFPISGPSAES